MNEILQTSLDETELVKIREALDKETLEEAIEALGKTLKDLGYRRIGED